MLNATKEANMNTRTTIAAIIAPLMTLTGFRFSKDYRRADRGVKAIVYRLIDTVGANQIANGVRS